jgi:hypothetical protein
MKILLFLMLLSMSFTSAQQPANFTQGITGKVYLKRGNNMPSPGRKPSNGSPVIRTILIYELTKRNAVTINGSFFTGVKAKLIAKTQSNADGIYSIALPVGKYSLFVEEGNQLYANSFDGEGNISPVEVKKDTITNKDLIISNQAVY